MSKYFGEYFGPSTRRPYFSTQMPQLFVIKICFTFKINTIYGTGQDTRNLCNKFNYQGSAIRILCLTVASPKSEDASSRALSVTAPCPRVKILGSLVLGSRVPALRVPGSPFSGPDLRIYHFDTMSVLQEFCQKYMILVFTSSKVVQICEVSGSVIHEATGARGAFIPHFSNFCKSKIDNVCLT